MAKKKRRPDIAKILKDLDEQQLLDLMAGARMCLLKMREASTPDVDPETGPNDAWYVCEAGIHYHKDGEIEVDEGAEVSRGEDPGAYVAAWVWVERPSDEEEDDGDE